MVTRKPDVARLLDRGERIGDGRGTATNLQKSEVILCISGADDIDRRYLQFSQCGPKSPSPYSGRPAAP